MTRDRAEGLPVERLAEAANEQFTGIVTRHDRARHGGGWDPYEVWQTRVRAPSKAARTRKEDPRDPQR